MGEELEKQKPDLELIKKEVGALVDDKEMKRSLLGTTFKGLDELNMRKAAFEGMLRGFTIRDFLDKNVYAVPYATGYSLVQSIDHCRKIGMRSGIVGKSAPQFTDNEDGGVESCSVTVKRKVGEYVGDYTATVYFDEYTTGKNLWVKKPRTMIAKVAEMHALRMACPEQLAQAYIEEEFQAEHAHGERKKDATVDSEGLKMGNLEKKNDKANDEKGNGKDAEGEEGVPPWRK